MKHFLLAASLSALCAFTGQTHAKETLLVENGQSNAEIIIAENAPRPTELAAEELRSYFEKITGAKLPLVTRPSGSSANRIYVGRSEFTDELGIRVDDLKHGAFRIWSGENWLALVGKDKTFVPVEPMPRSHGDLERVMEEWDQITGEQFGYPYRQLYKEHHRELDIWEKDERGSFNAVVHFLRMQGVRWYLPHEMGEVVPKKASIALPKIDETVRPDFPVRNPLQWARRFTFDWTTKEEALWQWRMGWNQAPDVIGFGFGAHGIDNVTSRDRFKRENPEFFALYGGKRETDFRHGGKPCLSSEGLLKANIRYVRAVFDHFDAPLVSVMPADAYVSLCQCDLCEGKSHPERGHDGMMSDYVWSYVNEVAKAVLESHPDKRIQCTAYNTYRFPPQNIDKLSPNIVVTITQHRSSYHDPAKRKAFVDLLEAWKEKLPEPEHHILINDKYRDGGPWPAFYPHHVDWNLKLLNGLSLGDKIETFRTSRGAIDSMPTMHLNLYVTSRLWWDADQDVDALLDDYYEKFYGPARDEMKAVIEYAEANWAKLKDNAELIDELLSRTAAARDKVDPDTIYGRRVDWIADSIEPIRARREQLLKGRQDAPIAYLSKRQKTWEIDFDGRLDEEFWGKWPAHGLVDLETGKKPELKTRFKVIWDGKANIAWFGIRCEEPDIDNLNITATEDEDTNIWHGDAVELMLETQPHSYYQIAVSPAGALVDADREEKIKLLWNSMAEVKTHIGEDAWTIEMRLPIAGENQKGLDPLNGVAGSAPTYDFPWYFNLGRTRVRGDEKQAMIFSPTEKKGFHDTDKFGKLYIRNPRLEKERRKK